MGAGLKFSENGDPGSLFSRSPSDSFLNQAASGLHLDVTQTLEAMATKTNKPSGHRIDVKSKNEVHDVLQAPFFDSYAGGATMEGTASGILGSRATANGLREMILPSGHQKSAANPQGPQTTGRITDSSQDAAFLSGRYGGNAVWASKSTHSEPNGSSQVMNGTPDVSKSSAAGFGVKAAVAGRKEATCPGGQSLRGQVLAVPEEITAPVQASRLPQSSPTSSSHRVAAPGTLDKNSARTSVNPAHKPSRGTSDSEYPPCPITSSASLKTDDHGPKEICQDYLHKGCLQSNCSKSHFHLPYRWQVFLDNCWVDFQAMEDFERAYCDPQNEVITIGKHQINFQKMTCGSYPIRRLSTPLFDAQSVNSVFSTKWLWYWRNEFNKYVQYGDERESQFSSDISSPYLESVFQSCPRGVVQFQAGSQHYELSFQGMIQTNIASKTQRHVVRRPVFVSRTDVEHRRRGADWQPVMPVVEALTLDSPPQRNTSTFPSNRYELVSLDSQDVEYVTISELFKASMKYFKITTIKRIWNEDLWNTFERKKVAMRNSNEMLLFHATCRAHVDYICRSNFDWILNGSRETKYGKGNYFAKEAMYSHKNCPYEAKNIVMFVARVLPGNSIEGNVTYSRAPALYDSCVDSRLNPSVFVIFKKEQICPAYVIEYTELEKEKPCTIS